MRNSEGRRANVISDRASPRRRLLKSKHIFTKAKAQQSWRCTFTSIEGPFVTSVMRKPGDMLRRLKRQDPLIGNIQDNKTNMSTAALGVAKYRYEGQLKEANEQGRVRYTTRLICDNSRREIRGVIMIDPASKRGELIKHLAMTIADELEDGMTGFD